MSNKTPVTRGQIWTVAKWEFLHFFKLKQEIISKVVMLLLAAVIYFFATSTSELAEQYRIAVNADFQPAGQVDSAFDFIKVENTSDVIDSLESGSDYDAVLKYDPLTQGYTLISAEKDAWQNTLIAQLNAALKQAQLDSLNLTRAQRDRLAKTIVVEHQILNDLLKNQADKSQTFTAFGVLILLFVAMFGVFGQLFVSITGEKQHRVTEQLMATMTPQTWIDGKLTGQILLALKTMLGTLLSIVLSILFFTVVIKQQALRLDFVNWAMLPWFMAFAIAGLALCAAFMAAVAAGIDDPNHSGKSALMMLPIAPLAIAFFIMDTPNSVLSIVLSYLPVTAFAVMPVRMSLVELPLWQPLVSLVLSVGCFYYLRICAARIFKMGMNMYGKEPTLKEMWLAVFK
ncbi:ABC transporter permease [Alteromonas gilva]|uniref:ABC transporter permease n=1 Tax=Alteromonas gilva TaxID=2987522 RepID=A0ABT5KXU9_9ALTE|nr:ABC transporter permease [Alteromonas gilva]MDC8829576.1 ABC transporter permease [Alteromonas gilva]